MTKRNVIDFARHVYGYSLAPILARLNLAWHRLRGKPYFGWYLSSRQGFPDRHPIMAALAESEARRTGAEKFHLMEVGSWAGGSALVWGHALRRSGRPFEVLCVDAWRPYFDLKENTDIHYKKMNAAGKRDRIFRLFNENVRAAGLADSVYPIRGSSQQRLPQFRHGLFHMIYLDGDHSHAGILFDLKAAAPLLQPGGILCGDDLEAHYDEVDGEYLRKNLHRDYMQDPKSGREFHPGITLALHEFFGKRVSVSRGFWAMRWTGSDWQNVELT